jgi:hypothetical protein
MSDSFTEVTRTSWLSRIKSAFGGVFFGIIVIIGGIILLSWNEGRTVKTKRALTEGKENVISISSTGIDAANENKLVHVSDLATTDNILTDAVFGISENAIHLHREVEMYQWKETSESKTEKKLGGAEETTTEYTYNKDWSSSLDKSSEFKVPEGHTNPSEFKYKAGTHTAGEVTVGDFRLNPDLINKIGGYGSLDIANYDFSKIENARLADNKIYIGKGSEQNPEIGDLKVSFTVVKPKVVSIVAVQFGNSFTSYIAENDKEIELLSVGAKSSEQMFVAALKSNKLKGYLLRLLGFVLIYVGFIMIFKPLSVLADVVPFIGSIVSFGTGILSFLLSLIIGLVTIAIAWIAYRPFVAIPLLLAALALIVLMFKRKRKLKKAEQAKA